MRRGRPCHTVFQAAGRIREVRRSQGVVSRCVGRYLGGHAVGASPPVPCDRQYAPPAFEPPLSLFAAQQFGVVDLSRSRRRGMGRHLRGQTGLHDAGGQRRELFQGHAGRAEPSHRQLFRGGRRGQLVDRYGGRRSELLGPEERPLRLLYAGEPQRHYVEHDQAAALRQGRKAADFSFQRRHQVVRRAAGAFACIIRPRRSR